MSKVWVLHGPNLNLLGQREPEIYGRATLGEIDAALRQKAAALAMTLECTQSNAEHELIDRVHAARDAGVEYIIINPGAFTHTSIALRDAFLGTAVPFIEVHISNVFGREQFRRHSYLSDIATGVISGLGVSGYGLALDWIAEKLRQGS